MNWDVLANTIGALDSMENVFVIMLFNSLGSNPDSAFSYHQELWSNSGLISRLLSNCGAGNFQVPQEGSVSVTLKRIYRKCYQHRQYIKCWYNWGKRKYE